MASDFLQDIMKAEKARLLKLKEQGDPTVDVHFFEPPWSIDALGPLILDGSELAALEEAALDAGTPKNFWHGHELLWQTDDKRVFKRFLSAMRDAEGQPWDKFFPAATAAWANAFAFFEADPEIHLDDAVSLTSVELSNRLFHSDPNLDQTYRLANAMVQGAVETAWHRAFAEGRILVFEHADGSWQFRPPRLWEQEPPFYGLTLEKMLRVELEKHRRAKEREITEARERWEVDRYNDFNLLQRLCDEDIVMRENIAGDLPKILQPAKAIRNNAIDNKIDLRYLFSIDLPSQIFHNIEEAKYANTIRRNRANCEDIVDRWFKEKVNSGVEWRNKASALKDIEEKLHQVSRRRDGWGRASGRIWKNHALKEWCTAGRKADENDS